MKSDKKIKFRKIIIAETEDGAYEVFAEAGYDTLEVAQVLSDALSNVMERVMVEAYGQTEENEVISIEGDSESLQLDEPKKEYKN